MLYKTWAGGEERGMGEGLCLWLTKGQRGLCVFVGGQKKKAVYETWCGLETGWGEGVVLGEGSLRACKGTLSLEETDLARME